MSEWLDIGVYTTLIVAVWGLLPAWSAPLTLLAITDRNPDWLAEDHDRERQLADSRSFRWSCLAWGSVSLLALLAFQFGAWPHHLAFLRAAPKWQALKDLNSTFLIAGLVYLAICVVLFLRWVDANVPLAPRREASLDRRSIHDFVPRPLQYAVYAAIALHLSAWVVIGITGSYAGQGFWAGAAFQFIVSGLVLLCAAMAVRRRPGAMDRIIGPGYRRSEVHVAFAAQVLPIPNGIAKLHEQIAGASSQSLERFIHLGLVLFIVAVIVWLVMSGRPPRRRLALAHHHGVV